MRTHILLLGLVSCQADPRLLVSQLNIRWDAPEDRPAGDGWLDRREPLKSYLLSIEPELLGLQELTASQGPFVREALAAWSSAWDEDSGVACFWRNDAARPVAIAIKPLPGDYSRVAVIVHLVTVTGSDLTFVSVHLGGTPSEKETAARILVEDLQSWPRPWIVVGDFNSIPHRYDVWPTSDEYPQVAALRNRTYDSVLDSGLVDWWKRLHPDTATVSASGFLPIEDQPHFDFDARLDWTLSTPEARFISLRIDHPLTRLNRPISDHWPSVGEFTIP